MFFSLRLPLALKYISEIFVSQSHGRKSIHKYGEDKVLKIKSTIRRSDWGRKTIEVALNVAPLLVVKTDWS